MKDHSGKAKIYLFCMELTETSYYFPRQQSKNEHMCLQYFHLIEHAVIFQEK